jgi:hypothetical protein
LVQVRGYAQAQVAILVPSVCHYPQSTARLSDTC